MMVKNTFHIVVVIICTWASFSIGEIRYRELPDRLAYCYNQHHKACSTQTKIGLSILHHCMSDYQWKSGEEKDYPGKGPTAAARRYMASAVQRIFGGDRRTRGKRQSRNRVRKAYHMLTDEERQRYHRAVQTLKRPSGGGQSIYDMIASMHSNTDASAHGGCNFPGWHKIYLLVYEDALQNVDPTVTIPYWDSTCEQYMEESAQSVIWSEDFLGNGNGVVNSGPFANWQSSEGPLTRNIGVPDTQLYTHEQIENTTRCTRMSQICNGQTDSEVDPLVNTGLEFHHGQVHIWVGGDMSVLGTAAYDPVFFMHHAFVDMIWHEFRENSRRAGVDVNRDYPTENFGDPSLHGPNQPLGLVLGENRRMTVSDAIDENQIPARYRYRYDPRPTCNRNRDCGSNKLTCVQREGRYMCIAKTLVQYQSDLQIEAATNGGSANLNGGGNTLIIRRPNPPQPTPRPPRGNRFSGATFIRPGEALSRFPGITPWSFMNRILPLGRRNSVAVIDQCPVPEHEHKPLQNKWCANGNPDTRNWVYIPVRVLAQRAPDFKRYGSYPIQNGQLRANNDIYAAQGYNRLRTTLEFGNPKAYEKCKTDHDPAGEVYIRTDGINYEGTYTEYAIIDQRLPLAISVAYVAVKAPENGKSTEVVLSAYDSCGRVCIPSCLDTRTNQYKPCSGALSINSRSPLMYSKNIADTILDLYDLQSQKHCPQVNNERIHVSFYCDYTNEWPWKTALSQPGAQPNVWSAKLRRQNAAARRRNQPNFGNRGPKATPRFSPFKGGKKAGLKKCDLGRGCIIEKANCNSPCQPGKNYVCLKKCNMFASCEGGRYFVKKCYASHYDTKRNECQPGRGHCGYSEWVLGK